METITKEMDQKIQDILQTYEARRDGLIPILQDIQDSLGYIPEESVRAVAAFLDISASDIYGVATFYTQFRFTRPGDHIVRVCQGTACHVRGGKRIMLEVVKLLGIEPGETTPDYTFSLESVACFGSCALSPVIVVDEQVYGRVTPAKVRQILKEIE